jgi:hypothetical protein
VSEEKKKDVEGVEDVKKSRSPDEKRKRRESSS